QQNYLAHGSIEDEKKVKQLKNYHLLFRILPITPAPVIEFILRHRLHRFFRFLPQTPILVVVDLLVSFAKRDYYALWAIRTYLFELRRRMAVALLGRANGGYKPAWSRTATPPSSAVPRARAVGRANPRPGRLCGRAR